MGICYYETGVRLGSEDTEVNNHHLPATDGVKKYSKEPYTSAVRQSAFRTKRRKLVKHRGEAMQGTGVLSLKDLGVEGR